MDIDHLKKLVDAVIDAADDGPAQDALEAYLREIGPGVIRGSIAPARDHPSASPVTDCSCACCVDGCEMVRCYGYASPHACMCASCPPDERCDCAFCQALSLKGLTNA